MKRVISGFQLGADIAGIRAAKKCQLETGGWMPKGWRTKDGPRPEYAGLYGAREHESDKYPPRTFRNVNNSDATIRLATNFNSPGERCTLKAIAQYDKPYRDVEIFQTLTGFFEITANEWVLASWIARNKFETINVAGNALQTIEPLVERFLIMVFLATAAVVDRNERNPDNPYYPSE